MFDRIINDTDNENYIDIINNVFDEKEIDNEIILTNSLFQIDEKIYEKNHNAKFFAVLCKCANFDSLMEKSNASSLVNLTDYDSIKYELHKISSSKQVAMITFLPSEINFSANFMVLGIICIEQYFLYIAPSIKSLFNSFVGSNSY